MKLLKHIFKEENKDKKNLTVLLESGRKLLFSYESFCDYSLGKEDENIFCIRNDYHYGLIYLRSDGTIKRTYLGSRTTLNENDKVIKYEFTNDFD